jgi:hypothetical protein
MQTLPESVIFHCSQCGSEAHTFRDCPFLEVVHLDTGKAWPFFIVAGVAFGVASGLAVIWCVCNL